MLASCDYKAGFIKCLLLILAVWQLATLAAYQQPVCQQMHTLGFECRAILASCGVNKLLMLPPAARRWSWPTQWAWQQPCWLCRPPQQGPRACNGWPSQPWASRSMALRCLLACRVRSWCPLELWVPARASLAGLPTWERQMQVCRLAGSRSACKQGDWQTHTGGMQVALMLAVLCWVLYSGDRA